MANRAARFTQADISRALRAAKATGDDYRVRIDPDGSITIDRSPAEAKPGKAPLVLPRPMIL
jgi:hypothetical protein